MKISQTVGLLKPDRTFVAGSVLVRTNVVMATTTLTPMGMGCTTREIMVAAKMARRWRWSGFRPGMGRK